MQHPNPESTLALRHLVTQSFGGSCDDVILQAIAVCGLVDLDRSVEAYHQAQRRTEEVRQTIADLQTQINQLNEKVTKLVTQQQFLVAQEQTTASPTLTDGTEMLQVLYILLREVQRAIKNAQEYTTDPSTSGIGYYQLPWLTHFVLPLLQGHTPAAWTLEDSALDDWRGIAYRLIIQRFSSSWTKKTNWPEVFTDLKQRLTPQMLQGLVAEVCRSQGVNNAEQMQILISQLRQEAQTKNWPADYLE